jgi:hypothetical protein
MNIIHVNMILVKRHRFLRVDPSYLKLYLSGFIIDILVLFFFVYVITDIETWTHELERFGTQRTEFYVRQNPEVGMFELGISFVVELQCTYSHTFCRQRIPQNVDFPVCVESLLVHRFPEDVSHVGVHTASSS